MLRRRTKGQTTVEYILLIIIVLGAFLGGGSYVKRSLQGRWKSSVDELGRQYDPRVANAAVLHRIISNSDTRIYTFNTIDGYHTRRFDITNMIERRTGFEAVGGY